MAYIKNETALQASIGSTKRFVWSRQRDLNTRPLLFQPSLETFFTRASLPVTHRRFHSEQMWLTPSSFVRK